MGNFLKFRRTKKNPMILGGVVLLFCVLGYFLWVPLKASRDVAKLRACEKNIKQLQPALSAYLMEHGKYPAKLSDLYPRYIGKLDVFVCPAKKRTIYAKEDIDSKSGYVLLMPSKSPLSDEDYDQPLLCDRRANHLDKFDKLWGGNILFNYKGCGYCQWMPDKRAISDWKDRFDFPE